MPDRVRASPGRVRPGPSSGPSPGRSASEPARSSFPNPVGLAPRRQLTEGGQALETWKNHVHGTFANKYFGAFAVLFVAVCYALLFAYMPQLESKTIIVGILLCCAAYTVYNMSRSELRDPSSDLNAGQIESRVVNKVKHIAANKLTDAWVTMSASVKNNFVWGVQGLLQAVLSVVAFFIKIMLIMPATCVLLVLGWLTELMQDVCKCDDTHVKHARSMPHQACDVCLRL